jgi:hypothetical protein
MGESTTSTVLAKQNKDKKTRRKTHHSTQKIDKDEETHRETAEAKQLGQEHKLAQIVHRRVNPTTTLGEQHTPGLGRDSMSDGIGNELGLERREMLEEERGEIPIFTEREQVLLVQRIDVAFCVIVNDTVGDDNRPTLVSCTDPVQGEAARKTADGAEQTLEGLGQMVREIVFIDLSYSTHQLQLFLQRTDS